MTEPPRAAGVRAGFHRGSRRTRLFERLWACPGRESFPACPRNEEGEATEGNQREMRTGLLIAAILCGGVTLFTGCSPRKPDAESAAAQSNPMQHGPDYFTAKWGSPVGVRYADEWGNTTSKEAAKGTAIKWKVNDTLSVEVQAAGEVVHTIQYTGQPGAEMMWTSEQISRALQANGHGWRDTELNPVALMLGNVVPHNYVSIEGNQANFFPISRQLTIKTPARVQAEQARRAAEEAAKAEAERKTLF